MQRSVRENIALPFTARLRRWGLIDLGRERAKVDGAVETLQIDARAGGEVRRLSGGNQQKVTIARWVAGGVHDDALLRSDARHRHPDQEPDLRAAARPRRGGRGGPALHLRAQGDPARLRPGDRDLRRPGRRRDRRRPTPTSPPLLRAAYNLRADAALPEDAVARGRSPRRRGGRGRAPTADPTAERRDAAPTPAPARTPRDRRGRPDRRRRTGPRRPRRRSARNAWTIGAARVPGRPARVHQGASSRATARSPLQGLATSILPLALAAVAQAIVVISGGIDLSIGVDDGAHERRRRRR